MRVEVNHYLVFFTDTAALLRTLVRSLMLSLLNLGLDPTMVLMRGPTMVILGLVLTQMTQLLRQMLYEA